MKMENISRTRANITNRLTSKNLGFCGIFPILIWFYTSRIGTHGLHRYPFLHCLPVADIPNTGRSAAEATKGRLSFKSREDGSHQTDCRTVILVNQCCYCCWIRWMMTQVLRPSRPAKAGHKHSVEETSFETTARVQHTAFQANKEQYTAVKLDR
jgi:hypothetical protein